MTEKEENKIELKRETSTEKIGREFTEAGQLKSIIKREYSENGVLVQETIAEYAQLYCGHVAPARGVCVCGRSYCSKCAEAEGANCTICGRFVMNCCKVRSYFNKKRIYCKQCSFFGWTSWLTRG